MRLKQSAANCTSFAVQVERSRDYELSIFTAKTTHTTTVIAKGDRDGSSRKVNAKRDRADWLPEFANAILRITSSAPIRIQVFLDRG